MSTGFSGNLGFPIPDNWNYDQFTEISGYHGKWDLDRVAYSGVCPAVGLMLSQEESAPLIGAVIDRGTNYASMNLISLIWHLERRFDELRAEGKVGKDYTPVGNTGQITSVDVPTYRAILNYMAKSYLRDGSSKSVVMWAEAAERYRAADNGILDDDPQAKQIIAALDPYLVAGRKEFADIGGGHVDLAHLAATCLGYLNGVFIPAYWTGWAGDLATGAKNVQSTCSLNSSANADVVARALIGAKGNWSATPLLAGMSLEGVRNECNYSDMCSDGDAIYLTNKIKVAVKSTHLLSDTMLAYYNNRSELANRFKQMAWSMGATTQDEAEQTFYDTLTGDAIGGLAGKIDARCLDMLSGHATRIYVHSACRALAEFVF